MLDTDNVVPRIWLVVSTNKRKEQVTSQEFYHATRAIFKSMKQDNLLLCNLYLFQISGFSYYYFMLHLCLQQSRCLECITNIFHERHEGLWIASSSLEKRKIKLQDILRTPRRHWPEKDQRRMTSQTAPQLRAKQANPKQLVATNSFYVISVSCS